MRGLADTSIFIARETARPLVQAGLPDELAVSVITVGELHAGVLSTQDTDARAKRLATLGEALRLDPVPVDAAVAEAWGRLRILLRNAGKRMPLNDSWIAATALALEIPVVTQDRDYFEIAGLSVVQV